MKVGMNIRSVRKWRGLTLDELSGLCGIHRDDLGSYELGKTTPRSKTVKQITAALDIPITFIQGGMGWTASQMMEGWETASGDNLLREGILENLTKSHDNTADSRGADRLGLDESDILALMNVVKASIPTLVEYMKDTRPEHEITGELLNDLGVVQEEEESKEELIRRYALTDEQWEQIKPMLPSENAGKGRPFKSNRLMLDGILFRIKSGAAWNSLPKHFGRYKCIIERLNLWRKMEILQSVIDKMIDMEILDNDFTSAKIEKWL